MIIKKLLEESLSELIKLICKEDNSSRIIIPYYRDEEYRYSEQELKQVFLCLLEKKTDFKYSVETPTKNVYRFSDEDPKVCKKQVKGYRSAQIDVSVYDRNIIKSHIEFKYGQVKPNVFQIKKDLLKMIAEDSETNYFVHYLVTNEDNEKTRTTLSNKFKTAVNDIEKKQKQEKDSFKIDGYNEKKKKVFVISQVLVFKSKKVYKNSFSLDDVENNRYE